jgi:hypothetical protein
MSGTGVIKPGSCLRLCLITACSVVPIATLRAVALAETEEAPSQSNAPAVEFDPSDHDDRPRALKAELPDGGSVELLGLVRSWEKSAGWWSPDGSPIAGPEIPDTDLKNVGTIAAFRVDPADLSVEGAFLEGSGHWPFKQLWKTGAEGILLGAVWHPEDRRFANLWVRARGRPGKRLHTFPLTAADAGKVRQVDQFGVYDLAGLRATGPSQFSLKVVHAYKFREGRLAAVDKADRLRPPTGRRRQSGTQESTLLTFDFPLEQLSGIVLWEPTSHSFFLRNVALNRGVHARPEVLVRRRGVLVTSRKEFYPHEPPAKYRAELPNGLVIQLLGLVRYAGDGLVWWAPDGQPIDPIAGILESDVEGYGTVIAFTAEGEQYYCKNCTERDGTREWIRGSSFVYNAGTWLAHLDPTGKAEQAVFILETQAGVPKTLVEVPVTADDLGKEKAVDRDGIQSITNIERITPDSFRLSILHSTRGEGLQFVARDTSGKVHRRVTDSSSDGMATLKLRFPIEQLAAVALEQRQRAEVRFSGIGLQPGRQAEVKIAVKDLGTAADRLPDRPR